MLLYALLGLGAVSFLLPLLVTPPRYRLVMIGFMVFIAFCSFVEGFKFISGHYPLQFSYRTLTVVLGIYVVISLAVVRANRVRVDHSRGRWEEDQEEDQDDNDLFNSGY